MAVSDEDIIRDTNERNDLQRVIADAETTIAVSAPGTRRVLENFVEQSKKRVTVLDKRIEESMRERAGEVQAQFMAIAQLAENETRLSESEKQTYSGFLQEEFFTKKDFGKLESFYAHTWDRLTEGGKDEMSHRIWEGIRRDEYRFTDLPRIVQEKEEDRVYSKLTNAAKKQDSLEQIPQPDRRDFIRAYETGNRKEAGQVLNRDSFRKNVALGTSYQQGHQSADVTRQGSEDRNMVTTATTSVASQTSPRASSALQEVDVDSLGLNGVKLADAPTAPSAAAMPDASGTRVNVR